MQDIFSHCQIIKMVRYTSLHKIQDIFDSELKYTTINYTLFYKIRDIFIHRKKNLKVLNYFHIDQETRIFFQIILDVLVSSFCFYLCYGSTASIIF